MWYALRMINHTLSPDLQTRESVMAAAGRVQLALTATDGTTRYIRLDAKRKLAGGGYEKGTVALDEATHVFVSEKGYGTERIGTYYPAKPGYDQGRFFVADRLPGGEDNGHVTAFLAAAQYVTTGELPATFASIEAESVCGMCGRRLEDPISVQRGIGPDCAAKPTGTRILHASAFAAQDPAPEEDPSPAVEARVAAVSPNGLMRKLDTDWIQGATDDQLEQIAAAIKSEQQERGRRYLAQVGTAQAQAKRGEIAQGDDDGVRLVEDCACGFIHRQDVRCI